MPTIRKDLTTVNFTKKTTRNILGIVLHSMAGTQAGSIAWFKNPSAQASAHYCIGKDGAIVQCVEDINMAWHAGIFDEPIADWLRPNPNNVTIGIELEDEAKKDWTYPQPQREALGWLVSELCRIHNIPKDSLHVLLHKNLNPSRRSDPVGAFDLKWAIGDKNTPTDDWIIQNSDKWRGVVWYLDMADPEVTTLENVKNVIGGYKSRITDLENQLKQAIIDKDLAITETANQKDKLTNQEDKFQRDIQQLKDEYKALKAASSTIEAVRDDYYQRISFLEGELRTAQKIIGQKDLEITELKSGNEAIGWLDKLVGWFKNRYK